MGISAEELPHGLLINNEYVIAKSIETLTLSNPWDESIVAKGVQIAGPADVDLAVAKATEAFRNFGKKLIDQPVIRFKFSHINRETEALQCWVENLIYQLETLPQSEADLILSGPTAQLKNHSGIVLEHVVREAIRIMGGIGLTKGGRGERVERIWRDVKAITVPGGSEEILLDLAVRRALKVQTVMTPAPKL